MIEIEIKFQIPPQHRTAVVQHFQHVQAQSIALEAHYYESDHHLLAKHHAAIRLRKEGQRWIQMLKAKGSSDLHRLEYDIDLGEIEKPELALHAFDRYPEATTFLDRVLGQPRAKLNLQFQTDVRREQYVEMHQQSQIELSLDIGCIHAQQQKLELNELEFELKQGEVADLIAFCQNWVEQFALWIDVRSKAERGHLLAEKQLVSLATNFKGFRFEHTQRPTAEDVIRTSLKQVHPALLANAAAIIDQVAEAEHVQAFKHALSALQSVLNILKDQSLVAFTWLSHVESLQQMKPTDLAQSLASSPIQQMFLSQLLFVYDSSSDGDQTELSDALWQQLKQLN